MSRFRVLFAIGDMAGGGAQRQMLGILNGIDRTKFEPMLYLVSQQGELRLDVPADVPVFCFEDWYTPSRLRVPGAAHRARIRHFAEVLTEQKVDAVYDRTWHMAVTTGEATRRAGTPRISVIVSDPQNDFEQCGERFLWRKRQLLTRSYQNASRVIAVSEGVRRTAMKAFSLDDSQIITVPNFFDLERIDRLQSEPLPSDVEWSPDHFHITAAGQIYAAKGYDILIDAVRQLVHERNQSHVRLHILGKGPLESEMRSLAQKLDVESQVIFEGYRSNPLTFFRHADLFCLASRYEGMPNVLAEAMLCSTPVLATDCPSGPRELLRDGELGSLIPIEDSIAMADGIDDAIRNGDRWQARTESANAHIREEYSPAKGITRVEELLTSIVTERGAAPTKER